MASDVLRTALQDFGAVVDESRVVSDAQSGAGVLAARTATGAAAYLKVTPAAGGPDPLAAARRELRFYRELGPAAPVRIPRVLGARDDRAGVALLLEAAGESRGPESWTVPMWAALGGELAALHSMQVPDAADWSRIDGTMEALTDPEQDTVRRFWTGTLPELPDIIADRPGLRRAMTAFPPVFVHGDCHTGNIVQSGGELVFCDWQSAGIGRPGSDLAFLTVRATPSGVAVPPALLEAYRTIRGDDRDLLARAVVAEELVIFVFVWPRYAALNTSARVARVVGRTRELARLWFALDR